MDCNKEEALRARDMAEKRMQTKDFISARKIALKAQQLYADLENINQLIMVCDVHCASDKKVAVNEMDWYSILQVEPTADEVMIKKQYRKFALLLHPDKNKFPGAESAFKLIGEAQRVLLDKDKRHLHDMKRKASVSKPAPAYRPQQRPPYSQNIGVQNNYRNNTTGINSQPPQHVGQQRASNGRSTFWTACPYCYVKYEYYMAVMNKSLVCQNCKKPFVAYERTAQGATTATNLNHSTFPQRKDVPGQGFTKVELTREGNSSAEHPKPEIFQRKVCSSELGSQKVNGKRRRKKDEESSESCDSESSIEDDDFAAAVDSTCNGERPRRSDRHRQRVSYRENESDDEEEGVNGLDGNKHSGRNSGVKDQNDVPEAKVDVETKVETVSDDDNPPSASNEGAIEIPEAEFFDFDAMKSIDKFEVGQIWSLYSDEDGLPKYYAQITKVSSPREGFKVRLKWLASSGLPNNVIQWNDNHMPICCGRFEPRKGGQNYTSKDSFSHQLSVDSTDKKHEFAIMPKKGQIWGLYKNWTAKMSISDLENCEYDVVEVLEETRSWIKVLYLEQVNGFNSVFRAQTKEESVVTKELLIFELLRFSHQIPAFKLTDEKNGSLRGFWELDPAALPVYYFAR